MKSQYYLNINCPPNLNAASRSILKHFHLKNTKRLEELKDYHIYFKVYLRGKCILSILYMTIFPNIG